MLPLILGIGAAALLLGRKAVKRATRSNPRKRKIAKRNPAQDEKHRYAIVYHWTIGGDADTQVVDAATVRLMPESWQVESWHATKAEANAALAEQKARANPARRRKGKRVSVDQAASRLAWWRWHHNPKRKMTRSEARAFFDAMYAGGQSRQESRLRSPAGEAERQARNRAALARLRAKTNPRRRRRASRRK
jgi:hypothetical protein